MEREQRGEAKKNVHTARLQIALVYFVVASGQVVFSYLLPDTI